MRRGGHVDGESSRFGGGGRGGLAVDAPAAAAAAAGEVWVVGVDAGLGRALLEDGGGGRVVHGDCIKKLNR